MTRARQNTRSEERRPGARKCRRRLVAEPRVELVENRPKLRATQLGTVHKVVTRAVVDVVERTDPRECALGLRVIRQRVSEAAKHVSPTSRKHDAGAHPRSGAMGRKRITDDDAAMVPDELGERRGALVLADPVHDDTGRGEAPHLPRLGVDTLEPGPAGLIQAEHRQPQHVVEERDVDPLESMRDRVGQIPQRLRRDHEAMPLEDPALPLERDVIEPLVEHDLDRERERVAAARRGPLGAERGLDAAAAPAAVLLLLDLDELVAPR